MIAEKIGKNTNSFPTKKNKDWTYLPLGILSLLYFILAAIGGIKNYTPVPYWDMWDGYISFFEQFEDGNYFSIFAQHNEHRIIFSRLLFLIDSKIFGGNLYFLIISNYLLAGLSAITLLGIIKTKYPSTENTTLREKLFFSVVCICFAWMQRENLTWGFQSQFLAAQLFPLIALFFLSTAKENSSSKFMLACFFGLLSSCTMANGVLALPLMLFYGLITKQNIKRIIILSTLSIIEAGCYFKNYHAPPGHGSLTDAFFHHPIEVLHFATLYIGSPFYYITGYSSVAFLAGTALISTCTLLSWRALRNGSDRLTIGLLTYLIYIGGTSIGTAGGRLLFGLDSALSGRYTTPALMAWAVTLILWTGEFKFNLSSSKFSSKAILLIFSAGLIDQATALHDNTHSQFDYLVGALALEMQVHDEGAITKIYPFVPSVLQHAKVASDRGYTIFNNPIIRNVRKEIGTQYPEAIENLPNCLGHIDIIDDIPGDERFKSVQGWIFDPISDSTPTSVDITSSSGELVGHAIVGANRQDVKNLVNPSAGNSGSKAT